MSRNKSEEERRCAMAIRDLIPWTRRETALPARGSFGFPSLREEVDRWFGDFFGDRDFWPLWPSDGGFAETFTPKVDVTETDKEVRVMADLPGMEEKDIQVDLTDDGLTIRGERKSEHEEKRGGFYRSERSYGSFERFITLPGPVEKDKAEALFKNGVLTVTVPKSPEALRSHRRIEVKKG